MLPFTALTKSISIRILTLIHETLTSVPVVMNLDGTFASVITKKLKTCWNPQYAIIRNKIFF